MSLSLSSWRAWIEISESVTLPDTLTSLSSWRAWIEMSIGADTETPPRSLSSWRAWIEISFLNGRGGNVPVALLMESVD